ncbi:MAG: hypothetical protein AB8H79_22310 [Myxococcota bacterium]
MGHGQRTARRRQQTQTQRRPQPVSPTPVVAAPEMAATEDIETQGSEFPMLDALAGPGGLAADPTNAVELDGSEVSASRTEGGARTRAEAEGRPRTRAQVDMEGNVPSGNVQVRRGTDDDHAAASTTLEADGTVTRGIAGQRRSDARPVGGDDRLAPLAAGQERDPRHSDSVSTPPGSESMTRRGTLTGGASYSVGRPTPRAGGGYTVSWRIDGNVGGNGSATASSTLAPDSTATGSAGLTLSGRRSGTEVFDKVDDAMACFLHFTPAGDGMVADQLSRDGLNPDWQEVDIGTERAGRVSLTVTAGAKAKIGEYFSLGATLSPTAATQVKAKRTSASNVELESKVTGSVPLGLNASGIGVGVTAEERAGIELTWKLGVDIGSTGRPPALRNMFSEIFTPPVEGATEISHSVNRSVADEVGVTLPGVSAESSDTIERIRTVRPGEVGEDGQRGEDRVSERVRGSHQESTEALGGSYARSTTLVDLNAETGGGYAQTRVASDDVNTSHNMLSQALTGEQGGDADTSGETSGTWVVHRTFTDAQLTRIYAALSTLGEADDSLERRFERTTLDALDALARATGALPAGDTSAEAQRAELLAGYIAETGRRGIDLLESVAGLRTERRAMLYQDGHRDPVFTSQRDEAEIGRQITGFEQADAAQVQSEAQGLYDELATRMETLNDPARYPEVPSDYRNELLGRYGGWIVRLERVLEQGGGTVHFGWGSALQEQLDEVLPQLDDAAFARQDAARRHLAWHEGAGTPDGTPIFDVADPSSSQHRGLFAAVWDEAESVFEHCDRRIRVLNDGGGINPSDPEASLHNLAAEVQRMGAGLELSRRQFETLTASYEMVMNTQSQPELRDLLPDRAPEPYRGQPLVRSAARLAN